MRPTCSRAATAFAPVLAIWALLSACGESSAPSDAVSSSSASSGSGGHGAHDAGAQGGGGAAGGGGNGAGGAGQGGAGGAGGFVHPGVLVDRAQLDFVKTKLGADPWKSALAKMQASNLASLSYKPMPLATVECGSFSNPDIGCTAEKNDVAAAYTNALVYSLTGDQAHANKAIEIMNAWASVLKAHTNSNAPLQSAWCASVFPRAAELIRYSNAGWKPADVAAFETLLKDVYLPEIKDGAPNTNGNWELSMIEAMLGIAVFTNDQALFDKAVSMWKKRVPAYVYLTSDGALPVPPPGGNKNTKAKLVAYWQGQSTFIDGLSQETCRDLGHVQLGFAAMINAAETAAIQGVDLYGLESKRLVAGYELHAQYLNGAKVPASICGGKLSQATATETWEVGYNEYANRLGLALPETKAVVAQVRPTGVNHMMVWETLTHAETGNAALP
jgi:hypothetical protein